MVFTLALDDLIDDSRKLLPVWENLGVNVLVLIGLLRLLGFRLSRKSKWKLEVLSAIVVPCILVFLK